MDAAVADALTELDDWAVALRRTVHARPEVAFDETCTRGLVTRLLDEWGVSYTALADPSTGVVAVLHGTGPEDPVDMALRAELDALPVPDELTTDYRSGTPGVSHSCGHDAHLAALLLAARVLHEHRDRWAGRIVLLFQAAEERPPGGALDLLAAGALGQGTAVYGAHLASDLPFGRVEVTAGPVQSANDRFSVLVQGRGGHGAMPETAADALVAASAIVGALQTVVSRTVGPLDSAVVTIGSMRSGSVFNAIADDGVLEGTVRTHDPAVRDRVLSAVERIATATADAHGCAATVEWASGYPAVVNDPDTAAHTLRTLRRDLEHVRVVTAARPRMESDDFAYYLQEHPGNFFFVGSSDGTEATSFPHHHPRFDIDERCIALVARAYVALAFADVERQSSVASQS